MKTSPASLSFFLGCLAATAAAQSPGPLTPPSLLTPPAPLGRPRFVENAGQFPADVKFSGHAGSLDVFVTRDGFVTRFTRVVSKPAATESEAAFVPRLNGAARAAGSVVRLRLVGANPGAAVKGVKPSAGTVQYLLGSDPSRWVRGARAFESFVVEDWLPGVSARFRQENGILTYDWILTPGAPASAVALEVEGADSVEVDAEGALVLRTPAGEIRHTAPKAFETGAFETGTAVKSLPSRFRKLDGHRVGFEVEGRDLTRGLVIDPGILYSSFIGGTGADQVNDAAADATGNGYFTGFTFAANFPTTVGAFDTQLEANADAFVTKIAADASDFVYSTYVGGSGLDQGMGLAVDALGQAHVAGGTQSPNFPTTQFAYDKSYSTGSSTGDAFVVKLSADGKDLVFGTFLGGSNDEIALRIALDVNNEANKNVVVTGWTRSADFITPFTAPSAFDNTFNGFTVEIGDAFVVKLDKTGSSLLYATLLGGSDGDGGSGVAVDALGTIYVTGIARFGFPVKGTVFAGNKAKGDAFVAAFQPLVPGAASLLFCSLLGGIDLDFGQRIVVDASPALYITGFTSSIDFPKVQSSFDPTYNGAGDAFVLKMDVLGTQLAYSTYLGGNQADSASGLAVDAAGSAFVSGRTRSVNFPVTAGAFDKSYNGKFDGFLTKVSPSGVKLLTSAFYGGINDDDVLALALAAPNVAWIGGTTFSQNLPVTPNAKDVTIYQQDGFIALVDLGPAPIQCLSDVKPIFISYIVGDLNLPFVVRTLTNCGSPESVLNFHVSEVPFVPWMSQSVTAGTIAQGAPATPVSIDFDPTGLPEGAVNALVQFENDDDDTNLINIPVVFTVQQDASMPFLPGDGLTGFIDFQGEFDKGTFSAVKGMRLVTTTTLLSGDVILTLELVDAAGAVLKTTFVPHVEKPIKRVLIVPKDGDFKLVLRGKTTKAGALTTGAYSIGTSAILPLDAKPYSKMNQGPPLGVNKPLDRKRRLIAGSTLDVTVEPTTTITGPLAVGLLDATGAVVDVSAFTQPFGVNGLQIVGAPIAVSGLYTIRVTGLASPKERVTLTITPHPAVGVGVVGLP